MGRYVFTPAIFESIDRTKPGAGGEIQLTDAIGGLLPELDVYGYTFDEGRYDIGSKLDYLRATVELALAREDLGPEFREWLSGYVREHGHRLTSSTRSPRRAPARVGGPPQALRGSARSRRRSAAARRPRRRTVDRRPAVGCVLGARR